MKIIGNGGHAKVIKDFADVSVSGYVIAIGDNKLRMKVAYEHADEFPCIALIHPSAWVSPKAAIGRGTVVMAGAIIQANARIGKHCIINSGATVDHDCIIEDFVHIAPGVNLCGSVWVGEGALVGVGSCAVPGAKIPMWSLVKAGTVAK